MTMPLKTAIITGANRGIGLALTRIYAESGKWKILACCRTPNKATALQDIAQKFPGHIEIFTLDVSDAKSIESFAQAIGDQPVDLLINNAGILGPDPHQQNLQHMDFDGWSNTFNINSIAPFRMVQAIMKNLEKAKQAKITTISSMMGALSTEVTGYYAYCSSKAAVNKVMKLLSLDLASKGMVVTMFHPGWVQTDMGGDNAEITPQTSAQGLYDVISSLTLADSGKFLTWNGDEHAW